MPPFPGKAAVVLTSLNLLVACSTVGTDIVARGLAVNGSPDTVGAVALEPVTSDVRTIGDPPPATAVDLTDRTEDLTPSATTEDQSNDPNRLICRKVERVGTHRRVQVCYTAAQREEMREAAREVMLRQDGVRPDAKTLNQLERLGNQFPGGF